MPENKTKATNVRPADYLAAVEPAARRDDAEWVDTLLRRVSGLEPNMWGPSIIGYGSYHYRYASGREGDAPRLGFSPSKSALVLYLAQDCPQREDLLARLGKHEAGVGCVYVKKLSDVDAGVLEELVRASLAHTDARYPR